jgi:hypothetical protein
VPDVSPMTNALGWSFAIVFACWLTMQLIEVWETWPREVPEPGPELEAPAAPQPHH